MKRYGEELTPASSALLLIHQLSHPCPGRACMEPFSLAFVHWMLECSEFSSFFFPFGFQTFPPSLTPTSPVFLFYTQLFSSSFLLGSLSLVQKGILVILLFLPQWPQKLSTATKGLKTRPGILVSQRCHR